LWRKGKFEVDVRYITNCWDRREVSEGFRKMKACPLVHGVSTGLYEEQGSVHAR